MPTNSNNQGLLSSWKEIARHLDCDERTCRRWELNFGLPIHRMEGTPKSRVYAYKEELDAWRRGKLNGILKTNGKELSSQKLRGSKAAKMLLWILPLLVVIIAGAIFLRPSPGQPADFRIDGSKLIVLDKKGKELWNFDTKLDDLISEQNYRDHYQVVSRSPWNGASFPFLFIKDLNSDGKNEVLFIPIANDRNNEVKLYCFDSGGKELWQYRAGRELVFGDHSYSPDYIIFGMELFDTNDDGNLEVFMFTGHNPHSPSSFVILDYQGRPIGEFINWGRMHDMACADLDGDNKKEVIISGMNDEYGRGFIAVFDSSQVSGSSPQSDKYECKSCGSGSERYYILFPRTDVDEAMKPDKIAIDQMRFLQNNRLELKTQVSIIFFELDFSFQVQDVKGSDYFRNAHRELKAAGKITSVLDDAYYEALKKAVLYWDGAEWTSTPTMNRNRNSPR